MIEPRVLFGKSRLEGVIIPPRDTDAGLDGVDGQSFSLGLRPPMTMTDASWATVDKRAANQKVSPN
eukprot:scaffold78688_cov59-Cyclotella_meneghiniana.AAC.4